jgi:hypothetical protein
MVAKQATLFPTCNKSVATLFAFHPHSPNFSLSLSKHPNPRFKMTPATLERISKLMAKYHIDFGGPVEQKAGLHRMEKCSMMSKGSAKRPSRLLREQQSLNHFRCRGKRLRSVMQREW